MTQGGDLPGLWLDQVTSSASYRGRGLKNSGTEKGEQEMEDSLLGLPSAACLL